MPVEIVEMPQEELFPKRSQPRPAAQEENIDKTSASEPTANRTFRKHLPNARFILPKWLIRRHLPVQNLIWEKK